MSLSDIRRIITGDKKERESLALAKATLESKAKKNCKQCYGRGYTATELHTGRLIACRCVRKHKDAKVRK